MRGLVWALLGIAALLWSGLAWLLYTITGSGGAAVVAVTRWLEIDPASTQWVADTLATAGGVAQWLVIVVWLVGIGVLGILGSLAHVASSAGEVVRGASRTAASVNGIRPEPVIEGQIRKKTVS